MAKQWLLPILGNTPWSVIKMKEQSATKVWRDAWKTALLGLLALLLSACGTFELGVETPTAPALENAEQARPATGLTPTSAGPADDAQPTATLPTIPTKIATVQAGEVSQRSYQSNDHSSSPAISADGRYVAFLSAASNLVPDDTNDAGDIFVYDRKTQVVELISLAEDGSQANDASGEPGISADGRWVVFSSIATNLVVSDTNGLLDVFLRDRHAGRTILVSAAVGGGTGNMMSMEPVISADGRWIAFTSYADNLVPETDEHTGDKIADTNGMSDIFVYDRLGGGTRRANLSSDGKQSNHNSSLPGISADGRWVVFWSLADNLAPGASRGIYLRDRSVGTTQWIADGMAPTISPGGHWIGFLPVSSELAPDDALYAALYERQTGEISVIGGYAQGGIQGWPSKALMLSMNGEWLAFQSTFNPPDDPDAAGSGEWGQQVWLRDQQTGMLRLVSATPDGLPGNSISAAPSLSADGRWIAFQSFADNLVAGDDNGYIDIFVYDRETGDIELVTYATHPMEAQQ
jgi:Tol biopolymer transport system component